MTDRSEGESSRARLTGAVYLLYFVTAVIAQMLASRKMVAYSEAGNVIAYALYLVLTLLLYFLFRPVNQHISLLAALFSLAGCTVGLLDIFHLAPPSVSPLMFFGWYCLIIGILILRCTFLPHLLGWLMAAAGLGWLAFVIPRIAKHSAVPIQALGILAEASLMLWLLVKGVDEQRWKQQADGFR